MRRNQVLPGEGAARSCWPAPCGLERPPCDLEVIIPTWNEERRLPRTLARTVDFLASRPWDAAILVVDNGSVDRTVDLARTFSSPEVPVRPIGCSTHGKGAAVRRGLLTSGATVAGFMDADLATPIETLDEAVPPILDGEVHVVIASRHVAGSRFLAVQSPVRRIGGAAFRLLAHRAVPEVHDSQCGFKFFDGDLARAVAARLHVDGFGFDVELLRMCLDQGATVLELPVTWSDVDGSTFAAGRDGLRTAAEVWQVIRARRFSSAR